jgi:hypothetical protein
MGGLLLSVRAALALLLAALLLSGCGGDAETSTPGSRETSTVPATTASPRSEGGHRARQGHAPPPPAASAAGQDQQSPSAASHGSIQFRNPGGDNSVQEFGHEANGSELAAGAAALHGFLEARVRGAWSKACSYLSGSYKRTLLALGSGTPRSSGRGCAVVLRTLSAAVPHAALAEAAVAEVGALRGEGERGFLLYYGAHHVPYGIPVARERGSWLLASIAGVPLG